MFTSGMWNDNFGERFEVLTEAVVKIHSSGMRCSVTGQGVHSVSRTVVSSTSRSSSPQRILISHLYYITTTTTTTIIIIIIIIIFISLYFFTFTPNLPAVLHIHCLYHPLLLATFCGQSLPSSPIPTANRLFVYIAHLLGMLDPEK